MFTAGLWPGAIRAQDAAGGKFRFFCVNDLHCMDEESARWLETRLIHRMKQAKDVDFCLVLGDLAEYGTVAELSLVRDLFKSLPMPTYFVPGNHDYSKGDDRSAYDDLFPKRSNYVFDHNGWNFVAIDSTQGEKYQNTSVQPATLEWLDAQLPKLDRSRPTVLFTHFPLGERVTYRPTNAEEVLRRFVGHNLRTVLGGHFHGQTERTLRETILTTNRCCALKRSNHDRTVEKGYLVCEVEGQRMRQVFVRVDRE